MMDYMLEAHVALAQSGDIRTIKSVRDLKIFILDLQVFRDLKTHKVTKILIDTTQLFYFFGKKLSDQKWCQFSDLDLSLLEDDQIELLVHKLKEVM